MTGPNHYDVTEWPGGDPETDIGAVINEIIADVKRRQTASVGGSGGKPGAVIHIPPGDYHLRTQVLIDVSFLRIEGSGHGFTSSSIRFNVPEEEWPALHELWPGGSRILVEIPDAAFLVEREGSPRISSVEFSNFCIDGLHFVADGSDLHPENTYVNGKTGIRVVSANDSFRVSDMGFVYLEHGVEIHNADALSIHHNFIAECGSCVELRGWGQASKVTDNLIGAGPAGCSIFAENHGGLLITANNVFPRGRSSVELHGVTRSSVTNNRLHSFYPGMVVLTDGSSENLVASNHLLRDHEPWAPFQGVGNGRDDEYGVLRISGDGNSVIGNHFSEVVDAQTIEPRGATPVIIRLVEGSGNFVSTNHTVGSDVHATTGDSAFAAQVDALLTTSTSGALAVTTVLVDPASQGNTVLDSGTEEQVVIDTAENAFRATPSLPSRSTL
ncbi:right-handed parallel beta-helix repeat-containing protein [Leifsonia shinshuensis]|uniref:NosD domain-containing protein n=1 Tax=Leifsonia shinshuensis TaxID=150026 RepID=UPI001F509643|nr:NosD domain-containing protein [Leifsonia shinshuensis]MCI0157755.1 right-handed parallel beta-helix repeat-containing protein [Leifsonia shinshuensis]